MKQTLTQAGIHALKPGSYDVRDTRQSGLLVRMRPSGHASYLAQYGRGRYFTLGSVDTLTPAQARAAARKVLGTAASGTDPMAEKRAARDRTRALTYEGFLTDHYE